MRREPNGVDALEVFSIIVFIIVVAVFIIHPPATGTMFK